MCYIYYTYDKRDIFSNYCGTTYTYIYLKATTHKKVERKQQQEKQTTRKTIIASAVPKLRRIIIM